MPGARPGSSIAPRRGHGRRFLAASPRPAVMIHSALAQSGLSATAGIAHPPAAPDVTVQQRPLCRSPRPLCPFGRAPEPSLDQLKRRVRDVLHGTVVRPCPVGPAGTRPASPSGGLRHRPRPRLAVELAITAGSDAPRLDTRAGNGVMVHWRTCAALISNAHGNSSTDPRSLGFRSRMALKKDVKSSLKSSVPGIEA